MPHLQESYLSVNRACCFLLLTSYGLRSSLLGTFPSLLFPRSFSNVLFSPNFFFFHCVFSSGCISRIDYLRRPAEYLLFLRTWRLPFEEHYRFSDFTFYSGPEYPEASLGPRQQGSSWVWSYHLPSLSSDFGASSCGPRVLPPPLTAPARTI